MIDMENLENLIGQMVNVVVSKGGKTATKLLKVCKVKAHSVLFIEVDKENRINTFRKFNRKDVVTQTIGDITQVKIKEGVMPDKWESSWDAIGTNPIPHYARPQGARPHYSNHSKGWAATIKAPMGSSMDALAVSVSTRSTTNSSAGFPMV